jgi:membrane protease YdiL (CAAX protease family)
MFEEPKSFSVEAASEWPGREAGRTRASPQLVGLQLAVAFALIEAALWTPIGVLGAIWVALALSCILLSSWTSDYSAKDMGLVFPQVRGAVQILAAATIFCLAIPLVSDALGYHSSPVRVFTLVQACGYAIWALVQQFILQSFFFLRLEALVGGRRAVWVAALLFGAVHIPSPVLTVGAFLGGLFFCEMFRRYRNIFPLGLAHAALGCTMAASFADGLLRHMLVGEAYRSFHP